MLNLFRNFLSNSGPTAESPDASLSQAAAPVAVEIDGLDPFPIAAQMTMHRGLPIIEWAPIKRWIVETVPPERRAIAWAGCERAWLLHFRDALGPAFRLDENNTSAILSSLDRKLSQATLGYMERTLKRIGVVLNGIARAPEWGKDLLIVFDDEARYYDYVSYYYPESGEFAFSSGMHINWGCSHFVTIKHDLRSIEPVIAHEMTHACLAHLSIPAWLNEGLAVNTEHRLAGNRSGLYTPDQMRKKHRGFWGHAEIQEFWSGKSFLRTDDGNVLSYDLARILVEQFSKDWGSFTAFVLAAERLDAGNAAARQHLGLDLGAAVLALLEKKQSGTWEPDPQRWEGEAEKGGFRELSATNAS
jgi:hypothetical protein